MDSGFEILYEDADLLAINKPAGWLVAPDRWDPKRPYLTERLRADRGGYLMNVHRLDFDTSGVLIFARNHHALSAMAEQFRTRDTEKDYVALVVGHPATPEMHIELPIGPDIRRPGLARIDRGRGKPAATKIVLAESFRSHALVCAYPETGRSHQVRVHLKAAGCPVVCDADYGDGKPLLLSEFKAKYRPGSDPERPLIARQALHAESLSFRLPASGEMMTIHAPWPKDLTLAVKYLRKYSLA